MVVCRTLQNDRRRSSRCLSSKFHCYLVLHHGRCTRHQERCGTRRAATSATGCGRSPCCAEECYFHVRWRLEPQVPNAQKAAGLQVADGHSSERSLGKGSERSGCQESLAAATSTEMALLNPATMMVHSSGSRWPIRQCRAVCWNGNSQRACTSPSCLESTRVRRTPTRSRRL